MANHSLKQYFTTVKICRFTISHFFNFDVSKPVVVIAGYPDYLSWFDRGREVATVREEWRQGTRLSWGGPLDWIF